MAFALTSGPVQPEVQGFQPAGVSDMVDLSTGDFKYNIPLLDIDGYPLNLSYQSGTGIEDEASWVGLGWNLNVGSINRQIRGIADDMAGDEVETGHYTKPQITVGGKLRAKIEVGGKESFVRGQGTFTVGIFNDNYTGLGAEIGINPGIAISRGSEGPLTVGLEVGVLSNTATGVDVSPYLNVSVKKKTDDNVTTTAGLSASLGYNTRSGMKDLTLGASFGYSAKYDKAKPDKKHDSFDDQIGVASTSISYNTEPIIPSVQIPYKTNYISLGLDGGVSGTFVYGGAGVTGYRRISEVQSRTVKNPTFGFLYAEQGKNNKNAVMDFTREKDVAVIPGLPNLAIPVALPDLFSYSSQNGSGQFRLYRGGTGIFFDNDVTSKTNSDSYNVELGFGSYFHGGASILQQEAKSTTHKWIAQNNYMASGDFQDMSTTNPNYQHVYFKQIGEHTAESKSLISPLTNSAAIAVSINGINANNSFTDKVNLSTIQKKERQPQRTGITFLTADECAKSGLDKKISYYDFLNIGDAVGSTSHSMERNTGYRKKHHISEMTVTDEKGARTVYGIPVYNTRQADYSFAIGAAGVYSMVGASKDQVSIGSQTEDQFGKNKGIDDYFHKSETAPYATSYLISGLLSPDYVDISGNGISDDDQGSAIKFKYSYIPKYTWRSPYQNATLNKGLLADADDDKASIIYGEKELYYVHSIESKTKIAYFITTDRLDGLGVNDISGGVNSAVKQKALKEIRLYSKADPSRPIKVVKFSYDYSLCPGVPNNTNAAPDNGKLTLKAVSFEYRGVTKGQFFPYKFTYKTSFTSYTSTPLSQNTTTNTGYNTMAADRWGSYRLNQDNPYYTAINNDEFPYSVQDIYGDNSQIKKSAGQAASLWHLSHIDLPTGGGIDVNYESDEYAYVQNKKAMQMTPVTALIKDDATYTSADLIQAKGFRIKLPGEADQADATEWFRQNYLNGSAYIYTKLLVTIATGLSNAKGQTDDYVPCYGEIKKVNISGGYANIILNDRTESGVTANPIVFAAWQKIKEEYPRYAYAGFDRRIGNEAGSQSSTGVLDAISTAISNLKELSQNFYERASSKGYASAFKLNKSFARITRIDGHKLGGGVRVSKIVINNNWSDNKTYGQAYNYDIQEGTRTISSGVASYEPAVGNDENPLKQPIFYMQKNKGAISNLLDIEEPFGESYFPAPSVVYSKVTVTDLDNNQSAYPGGPTGYTVNEFYTAKDFPVQVRVTEMQRQVGGSKNSYGLVYTSSLQQLTLSQGYSIELNDMHGKPKATRVFNQAGAEIASTINYYNTASLGGTTLKLKNQVNVVNQDGSVETNRVIARDVDFFTDFREQESINSGRSLNIGVDIIPAFGFPLPIPHWPSGDNSEYKLFRSACAVKVSQYYGVVDSVVVKNNGSTIRTANLAYDGLTGQPLVTCTQNEFKKDIYSIKIPAYWGYEGMGLASRNVGMILANLSSNSTGIMNSAFSAYLNYGDEFIDQNTGFRYWIVPQHYQDSIADLDLKSIVDRYGNPVLSTTFAKVKVVRGSKNQLSETMAEFVTLNNPIIKNAGTNTYRLAIDKTDLTTLHVLNASAQTYDENWNSEPPEIHPIESTDPYDFGIYPGHDVSQQVGGVYPDNSPIPMDRIGYWVNRAQAALISDNANGPTVARLYQPGTTDVMGVYTKFYVPKDGQYVVGYDAQPYMSFAFNSMCNSGDSWFKRYYKSPQDTRGWTMEYVNLKKGWVNLKIELTFLGSTTPPYFKNGGGIEIYDNILNDIKQYKLGSPEPNVIFSTKDLIYQPQPVVYTEKAGNKYYKYYYSDLQRTPAMPCNLPPVGVNPYVYGFKGNWRRYQSMVFQQNRVYANIMSANANVINVKDAGYLSNFFSYWIPPDAGAASWSNNYPQNLSNWITANTVTEYDKFGQELENKDALNRYSAAKFDFNGELPGAVASNARNREIYANSFEDSRFNPGTPFYIDPPVKTEFVFSKTGAYIGSGAQSGVAHTGKLSVALNSDSLILKTLVHQNEGKRNQYLDVNANKQYVKSTDRTMYINGFQPLPSKDYIFNVWVKDDSPFTLTPQLKLLVNNVAVALNCKALVEGWKLLEGTIITPAGTSADMKITLVPTGTATIYLDDLRIHRFDAHMKTYSYEAATMRLMAELDENCFATFYEYDSEGLLIRVKKETERGIMTIKETRSSQKKTL